MTSKRKRIIHIVLTVLIMAVIFVHSALSAERSLDESNLIVKWLASFLPFSPESLSFIVRKGAHFLEYLALGLCMPVTVRDLSGWNRRMGAVISFLICAAYAATDELHQMFVPGRSCEARDIMIDSLGALIGILIICLISYLHAKRKSRLER